MKSFQSLVWLLSLFGWVGMAGAQTIPNPSFEADSFTTSPGYVANNGGNITGWTTSNPGRVGLNPAGGNPFADNGAIPDGNNVAFIQATAGTTNTLSTTISNLVAGVTYRVSFQANHRSIYEAGTQAWSLNGGAFRPFTAFPAVGGSNPYYTNSLTFVASSNTAALVLRNGMATNGDSTVLVDNFTIAIEVDSLADTGSYTLRQAVAAASAGGTIVFYPTWAVPTTILLSNEIILTNSVTIDARGVIGGITLNGGTNRNRIFSVNNGIHVTLIGLTLTGGNGVGSSDSGFGGAIDNHGRLTLDSCTLVGNAAPGYGDGIYNASGSDSSLINCTLAGNTASAGGAIMCSSTVSLTNCTVSGNSAEQSGGGISLFQNGYGLTNRLMNCIVSGNVATNGADVYIDNYYFGQEVLCQFNRSGVNLIGVIGYNPAASYTDSGPVPITADPQLAPLGNYGGSTPTMPPLFGSPAIDAGAATLPTTDQRGYSRLSGSAVDLGAVEDRQTTVQNTNDNGAGSLRGSVGTADIVTFAPGLSGTTIFLNSNIVLTSSVTIAASSLPDGITLSGNNVGRVFSLNRGINVNLMGLLLTGGNGVGGYSSSGGAIYNSANLTLKQCTLAGNSAAGDGTIYANGPTTLINCTIASNTVSGNGGAIATYFATASLTHCTLSGNYAAGNGGGILIHSGDTMQLTSSIVSGNSSSYIADIFADNSQLIMSGLNLFGNSTFYNATGEGGGESGDARLAPLGNYGGSTPTMPPLLGSPAIDRDFSTTALTTDQRGYPRLAGSAVDIGAVEDRQATVTTTNDGGAGSLRASLGTAEIVNFAPALSGATILLTNEITLTNTVGITASSLPAGLTLSGNNNSRIFSVSPGQNVRLSCLTLTGGKIGNGYGGAVFNKQGNLALDRCTLTGNGAADGGAIGNGDGSGNVAASRLTLTACTLVGNAAGYGGAIANNQGTANLISCTLANNSAWYGAGGIDNLNSGSLSLTSCLIASNTLASGTGPDVYNEFSSITAAYCLIGNGSGSTLSDGANNNLVGSAVSPIKALLAPLGNYGGPTKTMPPLGGSPTIDAGGYSILNTDQRGIQRVFGPAADIGAVEVRYASINNPPELHNDAQFSQLDHTFRFSFTGSVADVDYSVWSTTNLSLPFTKWTWQAYARQYATGQYEFLQTTATNQMQFYRVISP